MHGKKVSQSVAFIIKGAKWRGDHLSLKSLTFTYTVMHGKKVSQSVAFIIKGSKWRGDHLSSKNLTFTYTVIKNFTLEYTEVCV